MEAEASSPEKPSPEKAEEFAKACLSKLQPADIKSIGTFQTLIIGIPTPVAGASAPWDGKSPAPVLDYMEIGSRYGAYKARGETHVAVQGMEGGLVSDGLEPQQQGANPSRKNSSTL